MHTSSEPDAHVLKKCKFLIDSTAFHGPWVTGAAQAQNWANTPSCKQQLPPRVPEWLLLPHYPLSCTCFRHRISNTLLSVVLTLSVVEDHPPPPICCQGMCVPGPTPLVYSPRECDNTHTGLRSSTRGAADIHTWMPSW